MAVARHAQASTVNIMLLRGANHADVYGHIALICAAGANHESSGLIARGLLQHGAAAGGSTKSGVNALMGDSWHGNGHIAYDIFERNVSVDAANNEGMTALVLMCAA
eukprot:jgi/Picsp_1/2218/NSC_05682-R1_ankyrin repeat-containing